MNSSVIVFKLIWINLVLVSEGSSRRKMELARCLDYLSLAKTLIGRM